MNFIYDIFSYIMKGCLYISGNYYVIALFFFALAMMLLLLPLAVKQHNSQIKMAQVKPKEIAIREKYKGRNDRTTQQKMTMEIQEMYRENGYSQFSGCLPLLIQLPIIFILFAIVRNPITYASNIKDFNTVDESKIAVEYYQEQIDALNKDKFETEQEYNEYVNILRGYQSSLGITKVDEKTPEGVFKFKYGEDEAYAVGTETGNNEMVLSHLIISGSDELQALIDEGKINASFLEKTSVTNNKATFAQIRDRYASFKDDLPIYNVFGLNFLNEPDLNRNVWLMLIPLLVFLSSFFQTKITRRFSGAANQTDANGNPVGGGLFMEVGMPLISAIFAYSMPATIGVYWIWRTLLGMVQTILLAKIKPIPAVTEEAIAEAKKAMKATQKKKKVITIEVDEDDNTYDDMIVEGSSKSNKANDPTQRKPRRIEMLTADDDEDTASSTDEKSENE
jgi:YidC/Oxa1 family membrane protein insertase